MSTNNSRASHKENLKHLLITKFVNKFGVNEGELELRVMIAREVEDLLSRGAATEAALNKLDRKLETSIYASRDRLNEPTPSEKSVTPFMRPSGDAMSMKSGRSHLSRSIAPPSARSSFNTARASQIVYHCDRAATMIPSDEQWKSIIENGIKDQQLKDAAKIKARLDKSKAVQAEQLKQMTLKQNLVKKERDDFKAAFLQNGTSAYDKFYAFQDKHQEEASKIKTEAKRNANSLGMSYTSLQQTKMDQMR